MIDVAGEQVGIVTLQVALEKARAAENAAGLDLVEISPNSKPPVCRIMDYGKYQFQEGKQRAQAKKKQRQMHIKEVKFRPTIEEGDYQVKLRNLLRFLRHGDKVKVSLRFRGREMAHQHIGMELLKRVSADASGQGEVEYMPKLEGRQLVMVINPKKTDKKPEPNSSVE